MYTLYLKYTWLISSLVIGFELRPKQQNGRRELGSSSELPVLGSGSTTAAVSSGTGLPLLNSLTASPTNSVSLGQISNSTSIISPSATSNSSAVSSTAQSVTPSATTTGSAVSNTTLGTGSAAPVALPLPPRITPALSLGGAILLITGLFYALIGIKNRWIHIFLSSAYLTSLSICVLIVYVINPPVSDAVQGAYFVGIVMTGIIFGGGALIFKEVTEGLGCLLGGFTLAMWFLTLKEGGLITNNTAKGIFIAIFCALAWSLSFSHHTRNYGLIGSTSFSGSTALVLGIDCFSKGGLKEFWVYIWDLNPNIFPLNTNTYPISRGTRVETIVIFLACIIGVISQLKIWKVVKDRQKKKQAAAQDEERRREVVEAALGKHLQRQNDRDRTEWEKQYGDRLHAKRDTILWADTIGEKKKRYSRLAETEVESNRASVSGEGVEMDRMPRQPRSVHVGRIKRQSGMPISSIAEADEPSLRNIDSSRHCETSVQDEEQKKSLAKLEGKDKLDRASVCGAQIQGISGSPASSPQNEPVSGVDVDSSRLQQSPQATEKRFSASNELSSPEDPRRSKRLSWTSIFSKSGKHDGSSPRMGPSQEDLNPLRAVSRLSRASSLAATLDSENDSLDSHMLYPVSTDGSRPPEIVISPDPSADAAAVFLAERDASYRAADVPPSPPALTETFDIDPEELVRLAASQSLALPVASIGSMRKDAIAASADGSKASDPNNDASTISRADPTKEVLTTGALKQVPNHLSHVVLSYRTNEWAKHISTAEAPVYEEAPALEGEASEAPAHLASPDEVFESAPVTAPPPLSTTTVPTEATPALEAAISTPEQGVRINPARQVTRPVSSTNRPELAPRSTSATNIQSTDIPRGLRSSSTPMLKQYHTSLVLDESSTGQIEHRRSLLRSASGLPYIHSAGNFSDAGLSQTSTRTGMPGRTLSQIIDHRSAIPIMTETRMQSYDSHQPQRRDTATEAQKRDAVLAGWRMSREKHIEPKDMTGDYRMQMVVQRQQTKAIEEQQKNMRLRQEMAIDARMRSRDMQELHREAIRRMQASANKRLAS